MGIVQMLFGKKGPPKQIFPITVQLNAKIMPPDRGRLLHDPLTAAVIATYPLRQKSRVVQIA